MNQLRSALLGKRIVGVTFIHDYIQLILEDDSRLNIYNRYTSMAPLVQNIGAQIGSLELRQDALSIGLSNGASIEIGFLDKDFRGPEAFTYASVDGKEILVIQEVEDLAD